MAFEDWLCCLAGQKCTKCTKRLQPEVPAVNIKASIVFYCPAPSASTRLSSCTCTNSHLQFCTEKLSYLNHIFIVLIAISVEFYHVILAPVRSPEVFFIDFSMLYKKLMFYFVVLRAVCGAFISHRCVVNPKQVSVWSKCI